MKSQNSNEYYRPFPETDFFEQHPRLLSLVLCIILLSAFAVRVHYYESSRAVGEVQYRSAIIARSFYFGRAQSIPAWRWEVNEQSLHRLPIKEPSITEYLASLLYLLSGSEHLWWARLLTSTFWIVGGALLFVMVRTAISTDAALFALIYYLFVPIGIFLSTSFQPDSLMIMMFVSSLFAVLRYGQKPSWSRLVVAGVISGLAILVKPLVLFAIGGAFLFVAANNRGKLGPQVLVHLITFSILSGFIGTTYYLYGIVTGNNLMHQAESSFIPKLLLRRDYWSGWILTATNAVGTMPLLLALLAFPMLANKSLRALVAGLWVGYVIFCLVFTYHIRFNSYYHAQLIVPVAISVGFLTAFVFSYLRGSITHHAGWILVLSSCVLMVYLSARSTRDLFTFQAPIENAALAYEIGQLVGHNDKTVYIASYYGRPLEYLGELSGTYWPRPITESQLLQDPTAKAQTVMERLSALDFFPEYFIITDMEEFHRHHQDLEEYLTASCTLKSQTDRYLIYHACD